MPENRVHPLKILQEYLVAVLSCWQALVTGGIAIAFLWLVTDVFAVPVPLWTNKSVAVAFLFLAMFQAWLEQRRLKLEALAKLRTEEDVENERREEAIRVAFNAYVESYRESLRGIVAMQAAKVHNFAHNEDIVKLVWRIINSGLPHPLGDVAQFCNEAGYLALFKRIHASPKPIRSNADLTDRMITGP